jgi:hypothetical protein
MHLDFEWLLRPGGETGVEISATGDKSILTPHITLRMVAISSSKASHCRPNLQFIYFAINPTSLSLLFYKAIPYYRASPWPSARPRSLIMYILP